MTSRRDRYEDKCFYQDDPWSKMFRVSDFDRVYGSVPVLIFRTNCPLYKSIRNNIYYTDFFVRNNIINLSDFQLLGMEIIFDNY